MKKNLIRLISILMITVCLCIGANMVFATPESLVTVSPSIGGSVTIVRGGGEIGPVEFFVTPDNGYRVSDVTLSITGDDSVVLRDDSNSEDFDITGYSRNFSFNINNLDTNVVINATFEKYEGIDINYAVFNDKDINIISNRNSILSNATFLPFIDNYVDGDFVLPDACFSNDGCVLDVVFDSNEYLSNKAIIDNINSNLLDWEQMSAISVDTMNTRVEKDGELFDTVIAGCFMQDEDETDGCEQTLIKNDAINNLVHRYVYVSKDFAQSAKSNIKIFDREAHFYSSEFLGVTTSTDVHNFDDMLFETNFSILSFTDANGYTRDVEVFYGTQKFTLGLFSIEPLECEIGSTSCSANQLKYQITGIEKKSGNFLFNNNEITFNNFYDMDLKMVLTLSLSTASGNITKDITINLARQAFGGNAGSLNGNLDSDYWTTQYRGVPNVFYSDYTDECMEASIENKIDILNIQENNAGEKNIFDEHISNSNQLCIIPVNSDFTPWAHAIYYDTNGLIVGTKSFDLNSLTELEGYSTIAYDDREEQYDLYFYGLGVNKKIKDLDYFAKSNNPDFVETIMYNLKVIKKTDALNLGVKQIALFITNGPLDVNSDLPELTYGVGEGRIFYLNEEGEM